MNHPNQECTPPPGAGAYRPRSTALSYLFEEAMRSHEGGATVIGGVDPGGSPAERIGPLRNVRTVH